MNPSEARRLLAAYPAIAAIDSETRDAVLAETPWLSAAQDVLLFDEGSPCRGFPLVVGGEVRVARVSQQGRELELYRVASGEVCVASTACVSGARPMLAHGRTSQPSEIALLSADGFARWSGCAPFRDFVFRVFAERLADLMGLVEAVAFQRLDQRLAAALLGHGPVVHATHQALADQLGTAREIVTRLLQRLERAGLVHLARERIEIADAHALRRLADPGGPADDTPAR